MILRLKNFLSHRIFMVFISLWVPLEYSCFLLSLSQLKTFLYHVRINIFKHV